MTRPSHTPWRPHRDISEWIAWGSVLLAGVIGAIFVLVATRGGPATSPDSAVYLSGAENLFLARRYSDFQLLAINIEPPGFSLSIAALRVLGIHIFSGARFINATAIGILPVVSYALLKRLVTHRLLAVLGAIAIACAPGLNAVGVWVWSEPVFCVIGVSMLVAIARAAERTHRQLTWIMVAATLAGIGFIYRYAGVTYIIALVVPSLLIELPRGWRVAVRSTLAAAGVSLVLPVILLLRNASHGPLLGPRLPSNEHFLGMSKASAQVFGSWILAGHPSAWRSGGILVIAITIASCALIVRRIAHEGVTTTRSTLTISVGGLLGIYLIFIFWSSLTTWISPPSDRIYCPMYVPLLTMVIVGADALLGLDWISKRRVISAGVLAVIALWVGLNVAQTYRNARSGNASQVRFSSRAWKTSAFMDAVRHIPTGAQILSNEPSGIYLATERAPLGFLPLQPADNPSARAATTQQIMTKLHAAPTPLYLAWSIPNRRDYLISPMALAELGITMRTIMTSTHGAIYRVTGSHGGR